jgi:hypothetical protein
MNLSIDELREIKNRLSSSAVLPKKGNYFGCSIPHLRDGIVHFGYVAAMHPSTFLDMFGIRRFRSMEVDVSKKRIEAYIRKWKKSK